MAAAIVPIPEANHAGLPEKLYSHCIERLEFYKDPTSYGLVDAIPKTDLGKIKRDDVSRQLGGMALAIIGEQDTGESISIQH